MKVTIDIDKEYNDKNITLALDRLLLPDQWERNVRVRRSAHDRIHIDIDFPDSYGYIGPQTTDYHDIKNMYFLVFRLAAGDDIRRVRGDAIKMLKGEEISHWIPGKEDYEKMREKGK